MEAKYKGFHFSGSINMLEKTLASLYKALKFRVDSNIFMPLGLEKEVGWDSITSAENGDC